MTKTISLNILPTLFFTIIIMICYWRQSGGDIAIQIMIVGFVILQIIIYLLLRIFVQFDLWKRLFYLIISGIISYVLFLLCLQLYKMVMHQNW
jgi:multisubunit Na+/H+ antiporter MnhE subunit